MINFDDIVKENIKEHNPNWPRILNHSFRMLVIGSSGSGKTNSRCLQNLFTCTVLESQDHNLLHDSHVFRLICIR